MKKHFIVFLSLILLLLLTFSSFNINVNAEEQGTRFPFEEYTEYYLYMGGGAAGANPPYNINGVDYWWTNSFGVSVNKYRWDEVDHSSQGSTFDQGEIAKQSAKYYWAEPIGMREAAAKWKEDDPYFDFDFDFESYSEKINQGKTFRSVEEQVKIWEEGLDGSFSNGYSGTRELTNYNGGWIYYEYKEYPTWSDEKTRISATYEYLRAMPEVPGLYFHFQFYIYGGDEYDSSKRAEFEALKHWKDEWFNVDYLWIWKDDYQVAGQTNNNPNQNNNNGTQNGGTTQNAEETPGEDKGTMIPLAIVVGIAAAGAAIAGVAGASGNNSDVADEDKKKKSYKMYVQKDFGDSIRKGAKEASIIRARMAEIDEFGKEKERNDLTAKITASAEGMNIEKTNISGKYFEATVRVPKEYNEETASITFTFTGEGGMFTNTINFKVVDGPLLQFIKVGDEEGTHNENCGIHVIFGDSFTYDAIFKVVDATTPPKVEDIGASNITDFNVSFEETGTTSEFKMLVKNNSKALDNEEIFKKVKEEKFEISINLKDEEKPIKGYVTIKLHPEGISVESDEIEKKGEIEYVHIYAYEKANAGEMDNKYQSTEMKLYLAIKGKDKAIIDPKEAEYKIEKIKDSGGRGTKVEIERSISEKYQYKEEFDNKNYQETRYTFKPESNLVDPDDGSMYLVLLPVSASYDGYNYDVDIPLRLCGIDKDQMEDWNKEYEKLKERIEKFSTPENKSKWMDKFYEITKDTKPSVEELRLTSKYVVMQYMRYWTVESEKHLDDAKMYDVIINYLEWAKFFGDCAFSMLLDAYAGPVASAFIAPAKDFFVSAIGEIIAAWHHGQKIDFDKFEFTSNLWAIGDNLLSDNISIANVKDALRTLSMYFAYSTLKNFYLKLRNENKFDIYGAIIAGFTDMTKAGIKKMAGKLFDGCMKKCAKFRAGISARVGAFVSKHLGEGKTIDLRVVDGISRTGYLRKILDGLFGDAVDKLFEKAGEIHDNFIESETNYEIDVDGHLIVTSYIDAFGYHYIYTVDVTQALINGLLAANPATFGMYIYNELFGNAPTASTILIPPKDPPLPNKD